jgi:hypothetical protein
MVVICAPKSSSHAFHLARDVPKHPRSRLLKAPNGREQCFYATYIATMENSLELGERPNTYWSTGAYWSTENHDGHQPSIDRINTITAVSENLETNFLFCQRRKF